MCRLKDIAEKKKHCFQNNGAKISKIKTWVKYSVIPVFGIIIILFLLDIVLGYTIKQALENHITDYGLSIFTLAISLHYATKDTGKFISEGKRDKINDSIYNYSLWSGGLFTVVYVVKCAIDVGSATWNFSKIMVASYFLFLILMIMVIIVGIKIEWNSQDPPPPPPPPAPQCLEQTANPLSNK